MPVLTSLSDIIVKLPEGFTLPFNFGYDMTLLESPSSAVASAESVKMLVDTKPVSAVDPEFQFGDFVVDTASGCVGHVDYVHKDKRYVRVSGNTLAAALLQPIHRFSGASVTSVKHGANAVFVAKTKHKTARVQVAGVNMEWRLDELRFSEADCRKFRSQLTADGAEKNNISDFSAKPVPTAISLGDLVVDVTAGNVGAVVGLRDGIAQLNGNGVNDTRLSYLRHLHQFEGCSVSSRGTGRNGVFLSVTAHKTAHVQVAGVVEEWRIPDLDFPGYVLQKARNGESPTPQLPALTDIRVGDDVVLWPYVAQVGEFECPPNWMPKRGKLLSDNAGSKFVGTTAHAQWPRRAVTRPLRVGDEVVTQEYEVESTGGKPCFQPDMMSSFVGKSGKITHIFSNGGYSVHGWSWPLHAIAPTNMLTATVKPSADEVPFVKGLPCHDDIEAATRLGLCWLRNGHWSIYRFAKLDDGIRYDYTPNLSKTITKTNKHVCSIHEACEWRPCREDGTPVAWDVVKAEVVKHRIYTELNKDATLPHFVISITDGPMSVASVGDLKNILDIKVNSKTTIEEVQTAIKTATGPDRPTPLPKDGDPMTVANAVTVAEEGTRRALRELVEKLGMDYETVKRKGESIGATGRGDSEFTVGGYVTYSGAQLDNFALIWFDLSRMPGETDQTLRVRCRQKYLDSVKSPVVQTTSEGATMSNETKPVSATPATPTTPTRTRRALNKAVRRVPVVIAVRRVHTHIVDHIINNFADGETARTRTAVRRVLERALASDYGKAGIALAAGSLLPVAAPYLGKAEGPINAAADELMAHGFEVAGVAAGEAVLDAVKPTLSILGGLVDSLASSGTEEEGEAAPQLPPARRSGLDFENLVGDEVVKAKR